MSDSVNIAEMEILSMWIQPHTLGLADDVQQRITEKHPTPEDLQLAERAVMAARDFLLKAEIGCARPS